MKSRLSAVLIALACASLAACGGKGEPKGQVVARVGNDEITVLDLQTEMGGFQAPNAQVRKAAEQQALNAIVQRKLLVQAAKKDKIDKSPDYARLRDRLDEVLLVKTWQDRLTRAVPAASPEEIQKFISDHPDLYSARKRIDVTGLRFNAPSDPNFVKAIQPLNTLPEVQALLTARNIPFKEASTEVDALAMDPHFSEQLLKLKPDAVFVAPQGNGVFVGKITGIKVDPVDAATANRHAAAYLRAVRTQQAMSRRFGPVVVQGMKTVQYNKAYQPPKPAAAAKPGAATPAAPPAKQGQ